jgi:predicted Zn finger-like uncharacterized protein
MNLACPSCENVYRIDPERVPDGGAITHCRECDATFEVAADFAQTPGAVRTAAPAVSHAAPERRASEPEGRATEPERRVAEPEGRVAEPERRVAEPGGRATEPEWPAAPVEPAAGPPPAFGPQDPETRARRLARALVSDMKVYNPEKWEESRSRGTLRSEFRDEILKSWDEYVEQVGERMAKRTPYFRDALNEILAAGQRVF